MSGPVLGVVPVRIGSTRLPDKPLVPVLGRPLVAWVWDRVASFGCFDHAVIATDSERVADLCRDLGAPVELTAPDHPSGTDRVAEVARHPAYRDFEVVVNVQGDEPLVDEGHVREAIRLVDTEGWDVGTCAAPVGSAEAFADPSVVKVVRDARGGALYFSRAPIPHRRDGAPSQDDLAAEPFLRHVGLYAFRREALARWVALPPSPLELLERLEQLRALAAGLRIGVAVVGPSGPGVDTPEDIGRLEEHLAGATTSFARREP